MKTLILGGINEGRDLTELLVTGSHEVITSLAGQVRRPARVMGEIRTDDFDGANGLAAWLVGNEIGRVVDTTHPSAEQINTNAVAARRSTRAPLLRISGPSQASHLLADTWAWVASHDDMPQGTAEYEEVLLTVGRQSSDHYRNLSDVAAHMMEFPKKPFPGSWRPLLEHGPPTVGSEKKLLRDPGVDVLIAKDSDGPLTEAELTAAADLGVRVIMVCRTPVPKDVPQVATPRETLAWVSEVPA